jgi:hypothetical protein
MSIRPSRVSSILLAAAIVAFLAAAPSHAIDFGVRAGAVVDDSDPYVGLELLSQVGQSPWYFNPNVEFVDADTGDRVSANFDFHFDVRTAGDYYLWAGLGAAGIHAEAVGNQDSKVDAGLNLLAGIGWKLEEMTPYAQLKLVASDEHYYQA